MQKIAFLDEHFQEVASASVPDDRDLPQVLIFGMGSVFIRHDRDAVIEEVRDTVEYVATSAWWLAELELEITGQLPLYVPPTRTEGEDIG